MRYNDVTLGIIGLGQIGASIAAGLKGKVKTIIGFDTNPDNANYCLNTGYISSALSLKEVARNCDIVAIATPVDQIGCIALNLLNYGNQQLVVFDAGSVKATIKETLLTYPKRGQFVSTHPMAGNAGQGPQYASGNLFKGKLTFICDEQLSTNRSVGLVAGLWNLLGSRIEFTDSTQHDMLMAYISHLPQLAAFALANTVTYSSKEIDGILRAASSGFDSMTRLALSSARMWIPIIQQNRDNILNALSAMQQQLNQLETFIRQNNQVALQSVIAQANSIRSAFEEQHNQKIKSHDNQTVKN